MKNVVSIFYFTLLYLLFLLSLQLDFERIHLLKKDYSLFLLLTILLHLLVHLRYNLLRLYNIVSGFFLHGIVFWWIPLFFVLLWDIFYLPPVVFKMSVAVFLGIAVFYEVLNIFIKPIDKNALLYNLEESFSQIKKESKFYKNFWIICFLVSFIATSLFFIKAGGIPLLSANPEDARVAAMQGSGIIHRFSFLSLHFGVIICVLYYFLKKIRIPISILILIFFLAFYNMLTGPRAEALWGIIFLFLTIEMLKFSKIKMSHGIVLLVFIFIIVAVVGGIRAKGASAVGMDDVMLLFVNRIYMNPVNAARIIDFFEYTSIDKSSFLIDLSILMPGHQPDLGTYLKDLFGIEFDGGGITVPLPAEGYMNFKMAGVYLYTFIFVLIIKVSEFIIHKLKNPFFVLFSLLVSVQFMGIITMGISGIIIKNTIPSLIVFSSIFFISKTITRMESPKEPNCNMIAQIHIKK